MPLPSIEEQGRTEEHRRFESQSRCNFPGCEATETTACESCHGRTCESHALNYKSHSLCALCSGKEHAAKIVFESQIRLLIMRRASLPIEDLAERVRGLCDEAEAWDVPNVAEVKSCL